MTEDILQPHIRCSRTDAKYALLPGDPERVDRVIAELENPKIIACNREFKTAAGFYKGIKVLVTSTGIDGPSTAIAVEELKNIGITVMIRIGSCGALQDHIKLGQLVIASGAVRDDGTSDTYIEKAYPAVPDTELLLRIIETAKQLKFDYVCGRIRSHDSFYTDKEEAVDSYWSDKGILGADMESAALFVVGGLRGIKTASILNVVVENNKNLENGINDYVDGSVSASEGERREILTALEAIYKTENNI